MKALLIFARILIIIIGVILFFVVGYLLIFGIATLFIAPIILNSPNNTELYLLGGGSLLLGSFIIWLYTVICKYLFNKEV